ncbi:MAG: nucleotidyltransferase domain-containing protein [Nanoarchaeota archaeon]|nr:nucleotidyltransferase domain-containing protein [Nanoarchaeota archaeon]
MKPLLWINPKKTNSNIVISDITILEKKWLKLLKWRWVFDWIPFVDFALVAGSMAMGEAREDSDFDIILGCKKGRMFTARAFIILFFNILGKRKKRRHTKQESKNKFCFNHFVTPASYTLRPPYNLYWQTLYRNLVPIYGKEKNIQEFFSANQWAHSGSGSSTSRGKSNFENRFKKKQSHPFRTPAEFLLGSFLGTPLEYLLARYQLKRIKKGMSRFRVAPRSASWRIPRNSALVRVHANENELELHPDTSRIEEWLQKSESQNNSKN